ncbi:MAG TPA: hypothetical protein PLJ33_01425 [Peptococcaceae bacterium]|jgi:hypothetical protein|nr:hypothetical protein [Clostridia bacterium]HOB81448.1 hypothetical protein [Peptococcaceae bacterium]HPZ71845.1 hypothetical protein [Peptococcaceae bacterium]HQD53499.1 hypothetical protein [Peptococcaceae bacterium]
MKQTKVCFFSVFIFLLSLFVVCGSSWATDERKGYFQLEGMVPSWVTGNVVVYVEHESGSKYKITLTPDQNYQNNVKLPVGLYTIQHVDVEGVSSDKYYAEMPSHVTIEQDEQVSYTVRVRGKGQDAGRDEPADAPLNNQAPEDHVRSEDNNDEMPGNTDILGNPDGAVTPREVDPTLLQGLPSPEESRARALEKMNSVGVVAPEVLQGGAGPANGGQPADEGNQVANQNEVKKESWGMRFLKRNWLSFLVLAVLCAVTLYMKYQNGTL